MIPLAWHNDPELKADAVLRMKEHRVQDEFIQGNYVKEDLEAAAGFRGCFHGCLTADVLRAEGAIGNGYIETFNSVDWHGHGQRLWGIPAKLGRVLDDMFETLLPGQAAEFAVAVTEAIPVGADLGYVQARLLLDLITDPDRGLRKYTTEGSASRQLVDLYAGLRQRQANADEPTPDEWDRADRVAHSARSQLDRVREMDWDLIMSLSYERPRDLLEILSDLANVTDDWSQPERNSQDVVSWAAERLIHHIVTAPVPD